MGDATTVLEYRQHPYGTPRRAAVLVHAVLDRLCALVGHAGGCWLLRRPLRRPWRWSLDHHPTMWAGLRPPSVRASSSYETVSFRYADQQEGR